MHLQTRTIAGKLKRTLAAADACVPEQSHRLFITDKKTGLTFLVDTGANVSVLPKTKGTKTKPLPLQLYAANNTLIPTYGERTLELDFNLRRPYKWKFIVAAVSKPILGADFLNHHNLLVDLKKRRLIDNLTRLAITAPAHASTDPTIRSIDHTNAFHNILAEFPGTTRLTSMKLSPKHNVEHHIETTGPPLYARARPLPPHRTAGVKKEFENMLEQGLCRPSKSPWASPLHVVPKKNGDLRVCGDYRNLNSVTKPDRYPIPRLRDFTHHLHGKKIFSTIDLNRAYQQIQVTANDVEKTAIITPFGLYEFPRMCPGLRNAGQTFQRFIHEVLRGLDYAFPFVDDVLLASENEEQHHTQLRNVLQRFEEYGITINPSKCVFGQPQVKFLGYTVNEHGIKPPEDKVTAITHYPKPTTVEELRRFLGMINYYRENIPNAASLQAPLNKYLHGVKKRDKTTILWTDEASQAFEKCKGSIRDAALLAHPHHSVPLALMSDASNNCAGAVLQQYVNNAWQPLGYFSKKFSEAQVKYSTYDRELLAIFMAIKHFRKTFEGRPLTIFTDHKPLTYAFTKLSTSNETPRRTRQILFISEFTTDIRHISGADNAVADALSRIDAIATPSPINYDQLANAQERDSAIPALMKKDNIRLEKLPLATASKSIFCECSTPHKRPYLPEEFRYAAYNAVHGLSHPGVRATRKLIQTRYFWPSMQADIGKWAKACTQCQRAKIQRHTTSEVSMFPPTTDRFMHIHIDIVGPLPPSVHGHRYLVTMVDRTTRWPEAIAVEDITAETVARCVYDNWISRYGCPAQITTDQGRQFESSLFAALAKLTGVEKIRTTPYHPQSNGLVERWHRTMKNALKARLQTTSQWFDELPTILLGLRATPRTDTGVSAAQLTYGRSLRLPGDFFHSSTTDKNMDGNYVERLQQTIQELKPVPAHPHSNSRAIFVHPDLGTCEQVFVRVDAVKKPLQPPYDGPFRVLRKNDKTFTIQLPGRQATISIDRLKPAYTLAHEEQSTTPTSILRSNGAPRQTRSGRVVKLPVRFA